MLLQRDSQLPHVSQAPALSNVHTTHMSSEAYDEENSKDQRKTDVFCSAACTDASQGSGRTRTREPCGPSANGADLPHGYQGACLLTYHMGAWVHEGREVILQVDRHKLTSKVFVTETMTEIVSGFCRGGGVSYSFCSCDRCA